LWNGMPTKKALERGLLVTLEELETRIKVVEDIEAIKKLRATYCYLVDAEKVDELLSHFTENAKVDFGLFGTYEGREGQRTFFRDVVAVGLSFCMHMVHNPIIEVKGEKATGKWYFEVPSTMRGTERAIWIAGVYDEEYVKKGGEWKFNFIKATFYYMTPYEEGWVKTPFMAIG